MVQQTYETVDNKLHFNYAIRVCELEKGNSRDVILNSRIIKIRLLSRISYCKYDGYILVYLVTLCIVLLNIFSNFFMLLKFL